LRKVSSAYAIPGISSSAAAWEYGHDTAGGSGSAGVFLELLMGGPRLSLDTSEGSDVKSVYGVPALALALVLVLVLVLVLTPADAAERERAGAEELSVSGEGGVV
jgi:hypothetical protein